MLCLPLYIINKDLYPVKFLAAIHFRTIYVFFQKILDFIAHLLFSRRHHSLVEERIK